MKIISIEAGPVDTFGYIVFNEDTKDCIIIDTPLESADILSEKVTKNGLDVKGILLTHTHWDHSADAPELKRRFQSSILVHKADEYRILDPNKHKLWPLPFTLEPYTPDEYLEDNQEIAFGTLKLKVIHTPGHTEGGICIHFDKEKILFSGDTLFNMSVGRVDLPGGDWMTLLESIKTKLMVLDDETEVYCGHGNTTTIGFEKKNNPFLTNSITY